MLVNACARVMPRKEAADRAEYVGPIAPALNCFDASMSQTWSTVKGARLWPPAGRKFMPACTACLSA